MDIYGNIKFKIIVIMTPIEFSNEFDILYCNITSNQAPGIDEYEKSVFLTKAQDELIKAYFNPKSNKVGEGFDDSVIRQADFSRLVQQKECTCIPVAKDGIHSSICNKDDSGTYPGMAYVVEELPKHLAVLNENITCVQSFNNKRVIPISYAEFDRLTSKPYKRPVKNCVWRLDINVEDGDGSYPMLIIGAPDDEIVKYYARYIVKPLPIITANFDNGVTIEGRSTITGCGLDELVHHEIVQRAAEMAKAAYMGDLASTVQLGTTSQTGIGYVPSGR